MEINFNLPGLREIYPLNKLFISMIKSNPEYFYPGVRIASVYGDFPLSLWSGGLTFKNNDQCSSDYIRRVISGINDDGLPIRIDFSSVAVQKDDLDDFFCNFILQEASNGMNEVIVASPVLEEYIRKNYPEMQINSSVCKEIKDIDLLNEECDRDYKLVGLDYNINNQPSLLAKIKKPGKVEVAVNNCCITSCPRRSEHYLNVAENNRIEINNRMSLDNDKKPYIDFACADTDCCISTNFKRKHIVSPKLVYEKYVPMGFKNFTIEPGNANIFTMLDTYCYYLLHPDYQGFVRGQVIENLISRKIISISRPKPEVWP